MWIYIAGSTLVVYFYNIMTPTSVTLLQTELISNTIISVVTADQPTAYKYHKPIYFVF